MPSAARKWLPIILIIAAMVASLRDAELLCSAQPRATCIHLDEVNHVLKSVPSTELQPQQSSYHNPSMPLAASVLPAIVRWIADSR